MEKFNNLVSLYQVHPALKKGDKNVSPGLQEVMNQATLQTEMARTSHSTEKTFDREYDQQLWFDKVQGSTEQKMFQAKMLTGGSISPVKEGGLTKYSSYCNALTHGLPSGEGQDDKKFTKLKIAGGDMAHVITNQYFKEGLMEAEQKDLAYQQMRRNSKFDAKKFFKNKA